MCSKNLDRNPWLRFRMEACRLHQYHKMNHLSKFEDKTNNNLELTPAFKTWTISKNLNPLKHLYPVTYNGSDLASNVDEYIRITSRCIIHDWMMLLWCYFDVTLKCSSKGTWSKNFYLSLHYKMHHSSLVKLGHVVT